MSVGPALACVRVQVIPGGYLSPRPLSYPSPWPVAEVDCLYPLLTLCPGMACPPVCSLVVLRKLLALLFQELLPLLFLLLPHGLSLLLFQEQLLLLQLLLLHCVSLLLFQEQLPLPLLDNVPWGLRGRFGELTQWMVIPR